MTVLRFPTVDGDQLKTEIRTSIAHQAMMRVAADDPWRGMFCRYCDGRRPEHRKGCVYLSARVYAGGAA